MNCRVKLLKSFMNAYTKGFIGDPDIPFTPSLVGSAILRQQNFNGYKISVIQARAEAKKFFDRIREWNIRQVEGHLEALHPHVEEPLTLEMVHS